jgi:hypothetical protein
VRRNERFKIISWPCIFFSKDRSFLDFKFSIKYVYSLSEFETLEYILQVYFKVSHVNKNRKIGLEIIGRKKFSVSGAGKYCQNF